MKTITLTIPDSLNLDEKETKTFLAAKLYEKGSLSLGQAADSAGYSKRTFMELLGNYDVSIFNLSEEDLENVITNARKYTISNSSSTPELEERIAEYESTKETIVFKPDFTEAFGAFDSEKSAEEIIEEIRSSRISNS